MDDLTLTGLANSRVSELQADARMLAKGRAAQNQASKPALKPEPKRPRWFAPHVPTFGRTSTAH